MVFATLMLFSCTDSFDCILDNLQKPVEVAVNEELNKYGLLKSYIDHNTTSLLLGAKVTATDFNQKDIVYSTIVSNFTAVDINGSFTPLNTLSSDNYDFSALQTLTFTAANAPDGIKVLGGDLCSDQGQRAEYLNNLLKPIFVPFVPEKGLKSTVARPLSLETTAHQK